MWIPLSYEGNWILAILSKCGSYHLHPQRYLWFLALHHTYSNAALVMDSKNLHLKVIPSNTGLRATALNIWLAPTCMVPM